MKTRVAIIGGGIVGLATAWKVSLRFPDISITLFEKEAGVGHHQSGNNSGVLHCGLYYKPGSLKSRMAVEGIREMTRFCEQHGIDHEICGKLVVATTPREVSRLDELEVRGRANGLVGVRRLVGNEMREREPHVAGLEALEVPEEGIVDYGRVCETLRDLLLEQGHELRFRERIVSGVRVGKRTRLLNQRGETVEVDYVVNCAGLYSDRVCLRLGGAPLVKIVPFRGEYFRLKKGRQDLVRHLIYPVPDPRFPFLGVHFSRLIHGGVEAGPNAVLAFSREGYGKSDFNLRDLAEIVTFPGLWRFAGRHAHACGAELAQSFSRKLFCRNLQKLVPAIRESDLEIGGAGVRAQAMSFSGRLVEDFSFVESEGVFNVLNAPSPAATASLAIGSEIASRIKFN